MEYWLHEIASPQKPQPSPTQIDERRLRDAEQKRNLALARNAEKLAAGIDLMLQGFSGFYPVVLTRTTELPVQLRECARLWRLFSRGFPGRPLSYRNYSVVGLLATVRCSTGRHYYRQVADILDVIEPDKWDEKRLKTLVSDYKTHMTKKLPVPREVFNKFF